MVSMKRGRKVISFCGVLQHGVFPLPELLQTVQRLGADEMKRPVEIEFACNLNDDKTGTLLSLADTSYRGFQASAR